MPNVEIKEDTKSASSINTLITLLNSTRSVSLTDSFENQLTDTRERILEQINDSTVINKQIKDSYGNSLTAIGNNDRVEEFTNYSLTNETMNYPLWLALYNDSWVFRKIIDKPAQDQISCGITLHGKNNYTKIYKAFDKFKPELTNLIRWGRLFGGSIAVMMFDTINDADMKYPLKKSAIKNAKMKLYVTDRWYGVSYTSTETVSNSKDIDFGKPKTYRVIFADGKEYEVDHSYILRYEHRTAPNLIKNGQLQGWGYAEGSHLIRELSRDEQLKTSITSLVNKSVIEVIKMSGMRGLFAGSLDTENENQLRMRLEMVNWGRSYNSLTFLDKDDVYEQFHTTSLSGLSDLLERNMWIVAAAADMPGILFGDLKGGLSQESDAYRRYADNIKGSCDTYVRPVITKFLKVLFYIFGIDETIDFEFNSLIKKQENNEKIQSIGAYGDVLQKLAEFGILSKYQVAVALRDFINNDIINITFSDENMNKLKLEEADTIIKSLKDLSKNRNISEEKLKIPSSLSGMSTQVPTETNAEVNEISETSEENADIGENINNEEQNVE